MLKRQQIFALLIGILNHTLFVIAVCLMVVNFYTGMAFTFGHLYGNARLIVNAILVVQFPLLHSFFLSAPGRKLLARFIPDIGRDIVTTLYTLFASLQLILFFLLWNATSIVLINFEGVTGGLFNIAFVISWLLLIKAILDSNPEIQLGYLGWISVFRNQRPKYRDFSREGLCAVCRQPIYLAFMLTLLTSPIWTLDRLVISIPWSMYCLLGPLLKERRMLTFYGKAYEAYQASVPYIFRISKS